MTSLMDSAQVEATLPTLKTDSCSIPIIEAIAFQLLKREIDKRPTRSMSTSDGRDEAWDLARDLLVYSNEGREVIGLDDYVGYDPDNDHTYDQGNPINAIGDAESFELGFTLALKLGIRIVTNPLGDHDLSALIDESRAAYAECLRDARVSRNIPVYA